MVKQDLMCPQMPGDHCSDKCGWFDHDDNECSFRVLTRALEDIASSLKKRPEQEAFGCVECEKPISGRPFVLKAPIKKMDYTTGYFCSMLCIARWLSRED